MVLSVAGLLAVAVLVGRVARAVHLPLTVVLAVVGVGAAALGIDAELVEGEAFEQVLVTVFLPVLVFAAALGLSTRAFLRDLAPIAVLATVALLVSALLVAVAVGPLLGLPFAVALLFGVITAATDPVAVVAVFQKLGVPRRLLTIVEGESLLNDGVAIVGAGVVLAVVQGEDVSALATVGDFVLVFGGGVLVGLVLGLLYVAVLPFLAPLPAVALSVAVAYGGFVGAEDLVGVSGVMAAVAAGCTIGLFLPTRGSSELRELLHPLWETLDWTANALLFLLLGLALDVRLLVEELPAVAVAVVATFLARPLVIVPLLSLLSRVSGVARVGWRNEAVMVWGGLRGAVALALVLALPEDVPRRDTLVAMTGGLVLVTLLFNATTIGWLVRRLGLADPSPADRYLSAAGRLVALREAREELAHLSQEHSDDLTGCLEQLEHAEEEACAEVAAVVLDDDERRAVGARQGLAAARRTYQDLSDEGLLDPDVARRLLHEVDDAVDDAAMTGRTAAPVPDSRRLGVDALVHAVVTRLPNPPGTRPVTLERDEAAARRVAHRSTERALERLRGLPGMEDTALDDARARLHEAHCEALAAAQDAGAEDDGDASSESSEPTEPHVPHARGALLGRHLALEALDRLVTTGVLPEDLADGVRKDVRRALRPDGSEPGGPDRRR